MEYKALFSAAPVKSLGLIMEKLRLSEADLALLARHREIFAGRGREFAEFFYDSFMEIPETRILLERYGKPDALKGIWAQWFERLFREDLSPDFVNYLWRIGLRHVEVSLDQRFSNLGFSLVRRFCHGIALETFPPEVSVELLPVIDKLVDFCILVETNAYIGATVRCDIEILRGIADKIRNPVTIIGGNLRRFQRRTDEKDPLFKDYGFLISYTSRCEDMIEDIGDYIDVFQREARREKCMLETVIESSLEKLRSANRLEGVKVETRLDPAARFVLGDPVDLRHLFHHIIENAADASRADGSPYVSLNSSLRESPSRTVLVEVFNNGEVINLSNIAEIMSPFYSTKPEGSGLGLSIARLALRKNFGEMRFEPVPGQGTRVFITLQGTD